MAEIILPTSAKQDDIQAKVIATKQVVDNIASNFPLNISGGGTDFLGMTAKSIRGLTSASPSHTTYRTILDITGSGIITLISAVKSSGTPFFRITVDGLVFLDDLELDTETIHDFFIPFKMSIFIELKSKLSTSQASANIIYLLG